MYMYADIMYSYMYLYGIRSLILLYVPVPLGIPTQVGTLLPYPVVALHIMHEQRGRGD